MTGIVGIEPTLAVLETDVLPLYDIPIMEEGGFEPHPLVTNDAFDLMNAYQQKFH